MEIQMLFLSDVCFLVLHFELSLNKCSKELENFSYEILEVENQYNEDDQKNLFHHISDSAYEKHLVSHDPALPTQLP